MIIIGTIISWIVNFLILGIGFLIWVIAFGILCIIFSLLIDWIKSLLNK